MVAVAVEIVRLVAVREGVPIGVGVVRVQPVALFVEVAEAVEVRIDLACRRGLAGDNALGWVLRSDPAGQGRDGDGDQHQGAERAGGKIAPEAAESGLGLGLGLGLGDRRLPLRGRGCSCARRGPFRRVGQGLLTRHS